VEGTRGRWLTPAKTAALQAALRTRDRMRAQEMRRSDLAVAASVAVVQRDAARKWAGDATPRLFEVDA
jgi:hypothetical protein